MSQVFFHFSYLSLVRSFLLFVCLFVLGLYLLKDCYYKDSFMYSLMRKDWKFSTVLLLNSLIMSGDFFLMWLAKCINPSSDGENFLLLPKSFPSPPPRWIEMTSLCMGGLIAIVIIYVSDRYTVACGLALNDALWIPFAFILFIL